MGHERDGMYGRYAHVPRDDLIKAVAAMPRLDFQEITYREWAKSGFGKHIEPSTELAGAPATVQPVEISRTARAAKGVRSA